jgi:hypothetical protein
MIENFEAGHEQAQNAPGAEFFDSVSIDFSDPERQLFGLGWMTRLPNAGRSHANLVLFAGGEVAEHIELEDDQSFDDWREASLDGVRMATAQPLERWSIAVSGSATSLELNAEAVTAPREQSDRALLERAGIDQYEQLCNVSGTVNALGRAHQVSCLGRRVHCWGNFAWDAIERWRALYAVSASGRAISVLAALPAGSKGHGEELRTARLLDEEEPRQFEDVYLSTVYGADRLPAKAGLELWETDEEIPRRFGGEAVCAMRAKRPDHELIVSFFRWSIEGEPAYGCYEVARR